MAKKPHRTFEVFDFLPEAGDALASKSARVNTYSLDPDLWRFHTLDTSVRPSGVVHVTFKQRPDNDSLPADVFAKDLSDLADILTNGSRIILDFEGVLEFDAAAIEILTGFKGKLRNKGSRVVLCSLEPAVQASFFPHLK